MTTKIFLDSEDDLSLGNALILVFLEDHVICMPYVLVYSNSCPPGAILILLVA